MKKVYVSPEIEIETYKLNDSIAANCTIVVSNGPEIGSHSQCEDYYDPFEGISMYARGLTTNFYADTVGAGQCDCYTTAGGNYWTS